MEDSTGTDSIPRRERERLARRGEILRAARDLFSTNGFDGTTLDDIARRAEYGKGTIYNYFSSKEDLFFSIIEEAVEGIHAIAESAVAGGEGNAREKLSAYARDISSYCREHCDLIRMIGRGMPHIDSEERAARVAGIHRITDRTVATLARPIAQDMRAGRLRTLPPEQVASLFAGAIQFYLMHRVSEEGAFDAARVEEGVSLMTTLFFDGLERKE